MNASSGIYNINAYNILCNDTTIMSRLNVGGVDVSNYFNNNNTNLSNINTNLNNLWTNSTLNINNLNATSTTLLGYINALTNPTILNVNKLNVSQTSTLHGVITCMSNLITNDYIQAPQVSLIGANPSFSMGGNVIGT